MRLVARKPFMLEGLCGGGTLCGVGREAFVDEVSRCLGDTGPVFGWRDKEYVLVWVGGRKRMGGWNGWRKATHQAQT